MIGTNVAAPAPGCQGLAGTPGVVGPGPVSHPPIKLDGMNPRVSAASPPHAVHSVTGGRAGAGRRRPARVYLWRRALAVAVLACIVWGSLWGVFRLGGLLGAHLIAPALGTAPVPAVEASQTGA
jgi:hypothetical protein